MFLAPSVHTDGATIDLNPTNSNSMTSSSTSEEASVAVASSLNSSLLLNDVLLPTFEDFAHTRSSSSILKDI